MLSLLCLTICLLHYVLEHALGNNGHPNRLDRTVEDEHDEHRTDGGFSDDLWLAEWLAQYDMDQVGFARDAGDVADADGGDGVGYINGYWHEDPLWVVQEDDDSGDDMDMYYDDEGSVGSADSGLHLDDAPIDFLVDGQEYIARLMLNEGLIPENWDDEIEESI